MKHTLSLTLLAALLLSGAACQNLPQRNLGPYFGPFHNIGNVYLTPNGLPDTVRRVAVCRSSPAVAIAIPSAVYAQCRRCSPRNLPATDEWMW